MSSMVGSLAESLGTNPDALMLILSILAGYPLALFHRIFLFSSSKSIQHSFFVGIGIFIAWVNFGTDIVYILINIAVVYFIILKGVNTFFLLFGACFNFVYLLVIYYFTLSESYIISFTIPQCVLTLRLTGLLFDIYDGKSDKSQLSNDQKESALEISPSLLELTSYSFFFGGFLVGPQFSLKRYRSFIAGEFCEKDSHGKSIPPKSCIKPAVIRLVLGLLYTASQPITNYYFPDEYLLSSDFSNLAFYRKWFYILLWGKLMLNKYISCWLLTEGACILIGLTYNKKDEKGDAKWNGCENINIVKFESLSTMQQMIESFNINTNRWSAQYVYKRFKFMGNRDVSQALTLLYLALWHGLHSGYFNTFLIEFFIMRMQREVTFIYKQWPALQKFSNSFLGAPLIYIFNKLINTFGLCYALVSFNLFTWSRYSKVYSEVFYCHHILIIGWFFVFAFIVSPLLSISKRSSAEKKTQ